MKSLLFSIGFTTLSLFAVHASADTLVVVKNSGGPYTTNDLKFYDANGTYLVLDGVAGSATITYPDQAVFTFPYQQTVSGLSVTGSWTGMDESGYVYTASVQETLVQTKHSGSGRGGGYKTTITTSLSGGQITYDYAGDYAPPLLAPTVGWDSTSNSVTLTWTSASGGVGPYLYSVYDEYGNDLLDTADVAVTLTGLTPSNAYTYTVVTTDSTGRQVASDPTYVYTQAPTLNTVYTYHPRSNTVTVTWNPAPDAVSYSVFYYDWASGVWVDGADTTGTSATVSGWSPDVYVSFYIASYDVNGVETDYDQQLVTVQPPSQLPGGDGGGD